MNQLGCCSCLRANSRPAHSTKARTRGESWRRCKYRSDTGAGGGGRRSIHIDPTEDGANVGFAVLDRLRSEMLHRVGLADLLKPHVVS